ncbi:MAG: hypothetical protein PHX93_02250 [Candidatus Peribacteraceae bacterium]|jgi:hypothetical protein|nr:hypothetical protein [Candidatus Peribacteraceae bacterium]
MSQGTPHSAAFERDEVAASLEKGQTEFFVGQSMQGKPFVNRTANQTVLDAMNMSSIAYLEALDRLHQKTKVQ